MGRHAVPYEHEALKYNFYVNTPLQAVRVHVYVCIYIFSHTYLTHLHTHTYRKALYMPVFIHVHEDGKLYLNRIRPEITTFYISRGTNRGYKIELPIKECLRVIISLLSFLSAVWPFYLKHQRLGSDGASSPYSYSRTVTISPKKDTHM